MASKYDDNTKVRAVRLVREHAGDYETECGATTHMAHTHC